MKNFILFFVFVFFFAGCAPEKKSISAVESPSTEPVVEYPTLNSPLYIELSSKWESEGDEKYQVVDTCAINQLAPVGTSKTCIFSLPEAQLFFSSLRFVVGTTTNSSCSIVNFWPYYYRRSRSNAFAAPGVAEKVNCDENDAEFKEMSPRCYGGAAPTLVKGFPNNDGYYFLKMFKLASHWDLPSENQTRWYQGHSVNYLVTSDLTDRVTPINSGAKQHTGTHFDDYTVACRDIWGEAQYSITFVIEDENLDNDPSNPAGDQFKDWDN